MSLIQEQAYRYKIRRQGVARQSKVAAFRSLCGRVCVRWRVRFGQVRRRHLHVAQVVRVRLTYVQEGTTSGMNPSAHGHGRTRLSVAAWLFVVCAWAIRRVLQRFHPLFSGPCDEQRHYLTHGGVSVLLASPFGRRTEYGPLGLPPGTTRGGAAACGPMISVDDSALFWHHQIAGL